VSAPDPFQGRVRVFPAPRIWDPVVNCPNHIWKGPGSVPEVRSLGTGSSAFHAAGPGLLRTSRAPRPPRRLMLRDGGPFTAPTRDLAQRLFLITGGTPVSRYRQGWIVISWSRLNRINKVPIPARCIFFRKSISKKPLG
jgi:hypothetical protein